MASQLTILHLYSKTFPGGGPHDPPFPRGICHNPQTLWWAFTYKRICNAPYATPPPQDSPGSCHCFGHYTSDRPATNVVRLADNLVLKVRIDTRPALSYEVLVNKLNTLFVGPFGGEVDSLYCIVLAKQGENGHYKFVFYFNASIFHMDINYCLKTKTS